MNGHQLIAALRPLGNGALNRQVLIYDSDQGWMTPVAVTYEPGGIGEYPTEPTIQFVMDLPQAPPQPHAVEHG